MLNDLRHALRTLPRVPGYSLAFVLTLGLGIGANTAIFSVIDGVLLRPLPYPDADRIMHLRQPQLAQGVEDSNFSFVEIADYRRLSKTMDQFVEFGDWTFNVLGRGDAHRATGGLVTSNFFSMIGARPRLGRMLVPSDDVRDAAPVVVLTDEYWRRAFGGDPSVIGQTLDLTTKNAQIVGVLAAGAHYATQRRQDFYANYAANDHYMGAAMQNQRQHRMTDVYARLAPGATAAAAQAELRQIAGRLHATYPADYPASAGFDTVVTPWKDELTAKARPTLIVLLVTTVFVLVIACANVANLTLTRLVQREKELAIRAALGARGSVLRRQLLAENLVLSVLGAAVGLGLSVATLDLLVRYTSRLTSRTGEIALDNRVLLLTLGVSIAVALLFAWAPRLGFVSDPVSAMAGAGGRVAGSLSRRRVQRVLVVSQLAVSFMLVLGAGLLTHSLYRLYAIDPGFNLSNVLSLQAPNFTRSTAQRLEQFSRDVLERLGGDSRIQAAAMASSAPLGASFPLQDDVRIDGADPDVTKTAPKTVTRAVSAGYFRTVGTPITAGRAFTPSDASTSAPVAIISESMARYYLKNQNPIGHHITWNNQGMGATTAEIVGVAADARADGITHAPLHTVYQPDQQSPMEPSTILVRAATPAALAPSVVERIRQLDPNRPIDHVETLEELRDESIAPQRLNATLIGLFALLALAIATVGVAGVLAFSVSQRRNELGIRLALGAERATIRRMILGEGVAMGIVGLVVGGAGAVPLSHVLSGLLFGVDPLDPPTIIASAVLLVAVALVAAWIPARTATSVDPMTALRAQ